MNVLVTGGNGFIARHIKEKLGDKYNIYAPTRQELDLLDLSQLETFFNHHEVDVVVHAATYDAVPAHYNKDPNKVLDNNLRMFFNLDKFRGKYDGMINLGSGAEYGRHCWKPRMKESDFGVCIPPEPYGFSKYICSRLALCIPDQYYDLLHLRLFAIFGEYEDWRVRYLSNAICRNIHGLPIKINQNRVFDFMDINDFIRIMDDLIEYGVWDHSVMNVCSGVTYDFVTLANMIHEIGGKDTGIEIVQDGMGSEYSGNNKLLLNSLQTEFQFIPMKESLKRLYLWYQERKDEIDPKLL